MNCPVCSSLSILGNNHPEVELYRCTRCGHRFSRLKPGIPLEPYDAAYFEQTHRNWFTNPNLVLFEQIARLIKSEPAPGSVIDVGCGNGNFLRYLAARTKCEITLTGIDLMANPPEPGIEYIQGDALSVSLAQRFSVAVSLAAIEHVQDIRAFAGRLKALVKPGGLVIVMTLNDNSILYVAARALRRIGFALPFDRLYSRHHIHHFSRLSLRRLLESEGLQLKAVILHNAPLAAIDIPVSSRPAAMLLRLGVGLLFVLGSLSRRTYLQTVVCRRA